jgi:hypothetical protein
MDAILLRGWHQASAVCAWLATLRVETRASGEPDLLTSGHRCFVPGDDIRSAIDVDRAAGDTSGQRRREVGAGEADIHDIDKLAERRLLSRLIEQMLEILQR